MENASAATTTMPVKLSLSGSKRRLRLDVPLKFLQLCEKVRYTFPDVKTFKLQYVDEEGDNIIVESDADLEEARSVFQKLGRVPTFIVSKTAASTVPPSTVNTGSKSPPTIGTASKSPTTRKGYGHCQRGRSRCGRGWHPMVKMMQLPFIQEGLQALYADGCVRHFGVTCDGSNQHPLVGKRYHKIGYNYDLNEAEFGKLPRHEQLKYEVIAFPGAIPVPVAPVPAAKSGTVLHFGITCDGSNQRPLVGKRYHKIGEDYDLNEKEFGKLPRHEQLKYEVIAFPGAIPVPVAPAPVLHFGITCDGSNQCPLVGKRYHKIGEDYDLNETEFKKLANDEQEKYELIAFPGATPVPAASAPNCVFVRDVTVPDKQVIPCGKQFKKTWLVKTGGAGWPAGCTLKHIAGEKMGASDRIKLGPQKAHQLVEVSIDFAAPTGHGKTTSKWRFAGPDGKFFGHTLWATIITNPSEEREAAHESAPATSSALQQLLEMGFALPVQTLQRVLNTVGDDVQAAVNRLCSMK